jgi:hypothetical protein
MDRATETVAPRSIEIVRLDPAQVVLQGEEGARSIARGQLSPPTPGST